MTEFYIKMMHAASTSQMTLMFEAMIPYGKFKVMMVNNVEYFYFENLLSVCFLTSVEKLSNIGFVHSLWKRLLTMSARDSLIPRLILNTKVLCSLMVLSIR